MSDTNRKGEDTWGRGEGLGCFRNQVLNTTPQGEFKDHPKRRFWLFSKIRIRVATPWFPIARNPNLMWSLLTLRGQLGFLGNIKWTKSSSFRAAFRIPLERSEPSPLTATLRYRFPATVCHCSRGFQDEALRFALHPGLKLELQKTTRSTGSGRLSWATQGQELEHAG